MSKPCIFLHRSKIGIKCGEFNGTVLITYLDRQMCFMKAKKNGKRKGKKPQLGEKMIQNK